MKIQPGQILLHYRIVSKDGTLLFGGVSEPGDSRSTCARLLTMQFEQQTSGRGNLTLITNWNSTIEGPGS